MRECALVCEWGRGRRGCMGARVGGCMSPRPRRYRHPVLLVYVKLSLHCHHRQYLPESPKPGQFGQYVRRVDRRTNASPTNQQTDQPSDGRSLILMCVGAYLKWVIRFSPSDPFCPSLPYLKYFRSYARVNLRRKSTCLTHLPLGRRM